MFLQNLQGLKAIPMKQMFEANAANEFTVDIGREIQV